MNVRIKSFLRKFFLLTNSFSPYPLFYDIRLSKEEISTFDNYIKNSSIHIEFGLGGSTIRALQKTNSKIETIETSKEWINIIKKYWYVRKKLDKQLTIHYVDIGPTKEWGYPVSEQKKESFPLFSSLIFDKTDASKVDTVLVDARFRVACTLMTILKCHSNENLKILIHDFWNRPHYHDVLKFLEVIEKSETLGVFKVKKDLDLDLCQNLYEEYKYNPK